MTKKQHQDDDDIQPWPPGFRKPRRTPEEDKAYKKARTRREKADMNREHCRREQSECQERNCANDATQFGSGFLGWCLSHWWGNDNED